MSAADTPELHELPPPALDAHLAILGIAGAGKTYTAKGGVEQLLDQGRRVCVIDPTGVWWGLRLQADGETEAYQVVIFGGDRADVPIDGDSGERLAELVAEGRFSCVIDVVRLTVGQRTRFFAAFAERLAQVNRRPLHLVIDEAHLFAPQGGAVQDSTSARMVGAANHLVSGGRALGLRVMLISQRPAKVHKDSLTQVSTLVAMRVISPQDRKAVRDWIGAQAERTIGDQVMASLASMPTGQGWVWAPLLDILAHARFRVIRTFDSSRTPDADEDLAPVQLGALQLDELRATLAAEAPAAGAQPPPAKRASKGELEAAEQRGYQRGVEDERKAWASWLLARKEEIVRGLDQALHRDFTDRYQGVPPDPATAAAGATVPAAAPPPPAETKPKRVRTAASNPASVPKGQTAGLPGGELGARQKVLDALAWWNAAGFDPVPRDRACVLAGYSPKASTFGVYVSELTRAGLLRTAGPGSLRLTDAGRKAAKAQAASVLEAARGLLSPAEARTFDALRAAGAAGLARTTLADRLGLSRSASTLGVYVSRLTSLGFVTSETRGSVRVVDWLLKEPG